MSDEVGQTENSNTCEAQDSPDAEHPEMDSGDGEGITDLGKGTPVRVHGATHEPDPETGTCSCGRKLVIQNGLMRPWCKKSVPRDDKGKPKPMPGIIEQSSKHPCKDSEGTVACGYYIEDRPQCRKCLGPTKKIADVSGANHPCDHSDGKHACERYLDVALACRDCSGPTAFGDGIRTPTRADRRKLWTPPPLDDKQKEWLYNHVTWRGNTPHMKLKARRRMLGPRIRRSEVSPGLPIEMATMWTGPPGSGKTSGMVEAAYTMHRLGWRVLSNGLELNFEDGGFSSLRELAEIITQAREMAGERQPTCVLLDEAPFWANARKWSEFDDGFFSVLQQVRKFGLALHYSSISPMQTDVNLRRLTLWWWVCRASMFRSFVRELWSPEEERTVGEKARMKQRRWHRQQNHKMYDTLQLLDPYAEKLDAKKDPETARAEAKALARWKAEGLVKGNPTGVPVGHVIGEGAMTAKEMATVRRHPRSEWTLEDTSEQEEYDDDEEHDDDDEQEEQDRDEQE